MAYAGSAEGLFIAYWDNYGAHPAVAELGRLVGLGNARLGAIKRCYLSSHYDDESLQEFSVEVSVDIDGKHGVVVHFADKKALFEALVIELQANAARRLMTRVDAASEPLDRLAGGVQAFLHVCVEPACRRPVIQDAGAVLGGARAREIEDLYPYGLLVAALKDLEAKGVVDVENAALAARMLATMVCEVALLFEGATRPKVLGRQAAEIVGRVLAALRSA